jgi:aryl-alcohol dehydrogenase-like predicted oxidoreductase
MEMQYRRLGRSGLQVSVLSFGSWVSFGPQLAGDSARECLAAAYDAGMNFFDNAEVYAGGRSETIMGEAIAQLAWPRHTYVVSSKYFWGIENSVNTRNTLNRKYLLQAVDGSLRRLRLDFLDLIFCHRPDPETPVAETVWAMHNIIESGRALYWGTSEWSAAAIREARAVADRDHLHRPVMEQPEYNLFNRIKVEEEFAPLSQLSIAWCAANPHVSTVITGASRVDQIRENLGALEVLARLNSALLARIDAIFR